MRRLQFLIAVAALTVTAISFGARDAVAYCRGCAMNAGAAAAAAAVAAPLAAEAAQIANPPGVDHVPEADVSANLPANVMNSAACHTERQPKIINGKRAWDTVEVCE